MGTHAKLGAGQYLVAEADESDGSFLRLPPTIAIITNIDAEHLDHYKNLAEIADAFVQFANKVPFYGSTIVCLDDPQVQAIMPGVHMTQFDVSPDESMVAYTTVATGGESQVWLAALDRSTPPRRLVQNADEVRFAGTDALIFRAIEGHANFLERIRRDGSGRERAFEPPVLSVTGVSPDGQWAVVQAPRASAQGSVAMLAVPLNGGDPRLICRGYCRTGWSRDGRFFYTATVSTEVTHAVPVPAGQMFPPFPSDGSSAVEVWPKDVSGVKTLASAFVAEGSDPARYVFVKTDDNRNLFRIPIR